jgi:hypothetical protein
VTFCSTGRSMSWLMFIACGPIPPPAFMLLRTKTCIISAKK